LGKQDNALCEDNMKKIITVCLFGLVCNVALLAEIPKWFYRHSDATHIVGNGSAPVKHKSDLVKAIGLAREDALQQISAQIYSEVRSLIQSGENVENQESSQFYAKEVQITSCLKLCGYEEVISDSDPTNFYVQLQISRAKMQQHYLQIVQQEIDDILSLNNAAKTESNARKAQKLYQQIRGKREDLNRDITILGFLQVTQTYHHQLEKLPSLTEIEAEIQRLSSNRLQSFEDLASEIIEQLDPHLKGAKSFSIGYYEWGNSGFASQFSSDFSAFLKASLEKQLGWTNPPVGTLPELSIFGEMVSEGKQICLFTRLLSKDNPPQTLISYINAATVQEWGMNYLSPANLDKNLAQDKLIKADARSGNELKIDVRTGEFGKNMAVYRFGDRVSIQVRANKACWVHLLYLEATGTKLVIFENYYIAPDMVNQWVLVADNQEASEPAGIEQIWVQADTEKLPELNTRTERYDDKLSKTILIDSLEGTIARTRGLKTKAQAREFSEAFLTLNIIDPVASQD